MLTSEYIQKLQELVKQYGDLPIVTIDYGTGYAVTIKRDPRKVRPLRVDGEPGFMDVIQVQG